MSLMSIFVFLLVGLVAGFLAGKVVSGHGFGILMDMLVGIIGAFLGGFVAGMMGIAATNIIMQIIIAFVGAVILLLILRAIGVGRHSRRVSS